MINESNYETYFLLLVDEELNTKEEAALFAFLDSHPQLANELDLLLAAKLSPDNDAIFPNKNSLLPPIDNSVSAALEEKLMLLLDQELNQTEAEEIEKEISASPLLQTTFKQLKNTKNIPDTNIKFPNKQSLLKTEKSKVFSLPNWAKLAAAVMLPIIALSIFFALKNSQDAASFVAAENTKNKIEKNENTPPFEAEKIAKATETTGPKNEATATKPATLLNNQTTTLASSTKQKHTEGNIAKQNHNQQNEKDNTSAPMQLASNEQNNENNEKYLVTSSNAPKLIPETPFSKKDETMINEIQNTYVKKDAKLVNVAFPTNPEVAMTPTLAVQTNVEKNSKLKNVFRTITRTIEKRTNIKTTNSDEKLLIGAFAIQL